MRAASRAAAGTPSAGAGAQAGTTARSVISTSCVWVRRCGGSGGPRRGLAGGLGVRGEPGGVGLTWREAVELGVAVADAGDRERARPEPLAPPLAVAIAVVG